MPYFVICQNHDCCNPTEIICIIGYPPKLEKDLTCMITGPLGGLQCS